MSVARRARHRPPAGAPWFETSAILAALALLAGAGCGSEDGGPEAGPGDAEARSPRAADAGGRTAALTVPLVAQDGSDQRGAARLTPAGTGRTRVVVQLSDPPAAAQPLHIHEGSCAALDPSPALPLESLRGGRSETVVHVAVEDLRSAPHAINAHASEADFDRYVACGTIPRR